MLRLCRFNIQVPDLMELTISWISVLTSQPYTFIKGKTKLFLFKCFLPKWYLTNAKVLNATLTAPLGGGFCCVVWWTLGYVQLLLRHPIPSLLWDLTLARTQGCTWVFWNNHFVELLSSDSPLMFLPLSSLSLWILWWLTRLERQLKLLPHMSHL